MCVECAGGTDTTDESLLLSIAPVWKMSLGLQGHSQLLSTAPLHCAGLPAGEHWFEKPLLWSGEQCDPSVGTAVGQLCPGAVPVVLKAHFSLCPFVSLCMKVLQLGSLGWPRGWGSPCGKVRQPRSSSRSKSSSCLVWLVFLAFLFPPFPAGLAGCPQASAWEVAKELNP